MPALPLRPQLALAAWTLVLGVSLPVPGAAQSVAVGDRVRLEAPPPVAGPIAGYVLEVDADGFLLGTSPPESRRAGPPAGGTDGRRILFTESTKLERFEGTEGHGGTGALIGGAVGLAVGLAVLWTTDSQWTDCQDEDVGFCILTVGGAVAGGALAGLVVGAAIRTEQWRPVGFEPLRR